MKTTTGPRGSRLSATSRPFEPGISMSGKARSGRSRAMLSRAEVESAHSITDSMSGSARSSAATISLASCSSSATSARNLVMFDPVGLGPPAPAGGPGARLASQTAGDQPLSGLYSSGTVTSSIDNRPARHNHVDDGAAGVAAADVQAGQIPIQLLQARGGVAEAGARIAGDVETGRQAGARIRDPQVKTRAGKARTDRHLAAPRLWCNPMADGVLDERLQQQRRHRHRERGLVHVPADVESIGEALALKIDVAAHEVDFGRERHQMIARAVHRGAHQLAQAQQHLESSGVVLHPDQGSNRVEGVEQEMRMDLQPQRLELRARQLHFETPLATLERTRPVAGADGAARCPQQPGDEQRDPQDRADLPDEALPERRPRERQKRLKPDREVRRDGHVRRAQPGAGQRNPASQAGTPGLDRRTAAEAQDGGGPPPPETTEEPP